MGPCCTRKIYLKSYEDKYYARGEEAMPVVVNLKAEMETEVELVLLASNGLKMCSVRV